MADTSREENLQKLITLLRGNEALTDFSMEEISEFAQRADFVFYEQGAQVIKQNEPGTDFFAVISGQARALDVNFSPPHLLNYMTPGAFMGLRALLREDHLRTATVEIVADTWLARYAQDDWDWLRARNPRIQDYFMDLERIRVEQALTDFPGRQWDEVVVSAVKRHPLAFVATLVGPLTLLIVPVLFLLAAEMLGVTFVAIVTDNFFLTMLATAPFVILAGLWTLYNYLDWQNDDFIVTTKRVIHIERVLFYGEARDEAPLIRIQDVTVTSPNILLRHFGYNHIRVKTAGAGVIQITGIPQAGKIKELIFRERAQALARLSASDLAAVRHSLARRLNWEETLEKNVMDVVEPPAVISTRQHFGPRLGPFNHFWPRAVEYQQDKDGPIVIWRKHYFVLLGAVILPILAILVTFYLFVVSLFALAPFGLLATLPVQLFLFFAVLASLFWYVWEYEGWREDIYIATNTRIIDIEASPFHIRGERRREGTYDNVQNITYSIPSFFAKVLNMGDVVIETAGTKDTFTFRKVFNPSDIQQEIFNRMVLFQQRKRDQERDNTTNQLVQVIGEYHNLSEKASSRQRR